MPESKDISQITLEETWMLRYWHNVSNLIREDIAYIWTEDAQKALKDMKTEAGRISLLLRRIHRRKRAKLIKLNKRDEYDGRLKEELSDLRKFIHDLNRLKAKEKWVRIIDEEIRQIIGELEAEKADLKAIKEQTAIREKTKRIAASAIYIRRFRELQSLGLNTTRYHALALFFVRHWDKRKRYWNPEDVRQFRCSESYLMFSRGIPAIADLINEENWPELLRLAKGIDNQHRDAKYETIAYALPCLKDLIREIGLSKVVDDLITLSTSGWGDTQSKKTFFGRSLPSVKDLINKDTWPSLIEMAEADGGFQLFSYGLPAVRDIFNQTTLPDLVKLAKQGKSHAIMPLYYVFSMGLTSVKHIINEKSWPEIVAGFEKLIELRDAAVFEHTLPAIKGIITEENWLAIVHEICDIHKQSKEATTFDHAHIHKAFRYVANIVDDQTRPLVFDELLQTYLLFAKKENHFYHGEPKSFYFGIAAVESILTKTNFPLVFQELRKAIEKSNKPATEFSMLYVIRYILTEQNISQIIDEMLTDADTRNFYSFLLIVQHLINDKTDLEDLIAYYNQNRGLFACVVMSIMESFLEIASSKKDLFVRLDKVARLANDQRYYSVQGLVSLGFLCCHVTNAYAGGAAGGHEKKQDPFLNIINDISNAFNYNPSVSVIKPGGESSIVVRGKMDVGGSIGVIYDYGYLYKSYMGDACTHDVTDEKAGISYRKGPKKGQSPAYVANYSTNTYNEVLIRKWTVAGIFYTKGCNQEAIDRLEEISREMSYKEYVNGAYWYRTTKAEVQRRIVKVFPVYEINTSDNSWKVAHTPKAPEGYAEDEHLKIIPFSPERISDIRYSEAA